MDQKRLKALGRDLTKEPPRSPRSKLGGFVILARCIDKCRSYLLGINGEYNFWPCSLCEQLEKFTGIPHEKLKTIVATGVEDREIAEWVRFHSKLTAPKEIVQWNNKMRDRRISEMPLDAQEFLEGYIQENLPPDKPVYVWFDVFDLEEGRL